MKSAAGRLLRPLALLALCAGAGLTPGPFADPPDDGIALAVLYGSAPGQIALQWTGGQPTFAVYRSDRPDNVVDPGHKLGETNEVSWVDDPPAGSAWFYLVTGGLDRVPPAITAIGAPPPNASGWNSADVTVTFDCADAGSGIATCPAPVVVASEGAGQTISGTATDNAGNTATATITLNIDKTPPNLTITAPTGTFIGGPSPDVRLQYTDGVAGADAASLSVSVDGNPLAGCTAGQTAAICPTPPLAPGNHPVEASIADRAGNPRTESLQFNLVVDQAPTLAPIGNKTAALGSTLSFGVAGSDPDGDPTTFDVSPLPLLAHASFDRATGTFTYKPSADQVGSHVITFSITDGIQSDFEAVTVTVPAPNAGAPGTLHGRVLDANSYMNNSEVPIVNATISLMGTFRSALSDAQGNFTITNVPGGDQLLDIAVGTAQPAPDGSLYGGFREAIHLIGGVDNVVDRPFFLPRINEASRTTVNPVQTTVVTNPSLGATLVVPPHTAKNPDGSDFTGQLSISLVPRGLAPAPLPSNLDPALLITIQPVGVVFATPVALTLANVDQVPANNDMNLWSLLASEGRFAVVGRGAVSADGQKIETITGGVRAADWHLFLPPEPLTSGPPGRAGCPEGTCCAANIDGSAFTFRDGALLEDYVLPGVRSLGTSRSLQLTYRSTTADLRPILPLDSFLSIRAAVPHTFSARLDVGGTTQGSAVFYDTATLPENDDSTSRLGLQFDASSFPTGLYPFTAKVFSNYAQSSIGAFLTDQIAVVNQRSSPIGVGWGIKGLQRLHIQDDGSALLVDGDGSALAFQPAKVGIFRPVPSMNSRRGEGPVAALLPDGRVLVAGGNIINGATNTAELFDPVTENWTYTGTMGHARTDGHTATLLRDGRVLVAGGWTPTGVHPSADIYNPATGLFTFNGAMVTPRQQHTATLLGDGKVLLASGTTVNGLSTSSAELYDPASNQFRPTQAPMFFGHMDFTATSLPDGRVLLAGGQPFCQFPAQNRVELYDPFTQKFTWIGNLTLPRTGHVAALLPNGQVLIAGGSQANSSCIFTGLLDTAEIFDPATGSSRALTSTLCSKKYRASISPLPDGRFLIAGGFSRDNSHDASGCADIYDPATETFNPTGRMVIPRGDHFAVPLQNGDILMGGGNDEAGDTTTATAEIFEIVTPEEGVFQSPPGDFTALRRNLDGTFTRTFKDQTKVLFNAAGLQTAVIDRNNNTTTYVYDAAGRLTSMTDPVGQIWTLDYDASGRLQSVTDPASRITSFAHDGGGNLVQITKADGNTIGYDYDPQHRLTRKTDERGKLLTHVYDAIGRLTSVNYPMGEVRRFFPTQVQGVVDPSSGLGTPTSPAPITRTQDVVARMEDGNGHTVRRILDSFGTPIRVEDPLGRATQTTRDGNNLPTRIVRPNGSTVTMTYDGYGNLLTSTEQDDPNGPATTTYVYEPVFNQVISITDPLTHATTIDHDARGNPKTITNALEKATILDYDPRGLLTLIQNPLGDLAQFEYDLRGNLQTIIDPRSKTTTLTRDAAGNVTESQDPLTHVTRAEYSLLNRLTRGFDALNGVTRYTYDEAGNLIALTDANSHATTFGYDDRNLLIETRNALGQPRTYFYDPARNLDHVIDPEGQRIEFTYNEADELTRKVLKDSVGSVTGTVNYGYDLLGNLTSASDSDSSLSFTYDPLGRLSTASTTAGPAQPATTISYLYDKAGNRKRMTDPHGNQTTYVYDSVDRLATLTSIDGTFTFGYDDASRRMSLQFPNSTKASYSFDAASQLTALHYLDAAQALLSKFDYTYDDRGNRDSRTTLDGVTSYTYDSLDRLTGAVGPDPANPTQAATETYSYDAVGNRVSSHLATGQAHDAANRMLADSKFTYTYDANGNRTGKQDRVSGASWIYTWDAEDRLVEVGTAGLTVTFRYDPLGRRIERTGSTTTRYLYDQEDVVEVLDGSNALKIRYTHGPGIDEPLARRSVPPNTPMFYQADGVGSVVGMTDMSQSVTSTFRYDSYGNSGSPGLQADYDFTGREWDEEIGMYHYRSRYYDPHQGRFVSEDVVGGGVSDYSYAQGNPLAFIDPWGASAEDAQFMLSQVLSQFPDIKPSGRLKFEDDPSSSHTLGFTGWFGDIYLPTHFLSEKCLSLREWEDLFYTIFHEGMHSTDNFFLRNFATEEHHASIFHRESYEHLRPKGWVGRVMMWGTPREVPVDETSLYQEYRQNSPDCKQKVCGK